MCVCVGTFVTVLTAMCLKIMRQCHLVNWLGTDEHIQPVDYSKDTKPLSEVSVPLSEEMVFTYQKLQWML